MSDLTEQGRMDVETLDRLFAQSWAHIAQIARARYLLTGEMPKFPGWLQDEDALKSGNFPE